MTRNVPLKYELIWLISYGVGCISYEIFGYPFPITHSVLHTKVGGYRIRKKADIRNFSVRIPDLDIRTSIYQCLGPYSNPVPSVLAYSICSYLYLVHEYEFWYEPPNTGIDSDQTKMRFSYGPQVRSLLVLNLIKTCQV